MSPDPESPNPRRVSLRDIAQSLGVNHSTVSRALRNKSRVSVELRHKIQRAAVELGYRPDPMLSALANYRQGKTSQQVSNAIAWINSWPVPTDLRKFREFDEYWQGAAGAAEKLGYRLEEFACNEKMPLDRLDKILRARGVEGILIPPQRGTLSWNEFHWENYSAARFQRGPRYPPLHLVTSDQASNAMLAFDRIQSKGYRRIGFLTGRAPDSGMMFQAGFLMAQARAGEELAVLPSLYLNEANPDTHQEQVRAWLQLAKPDAILTDVASALGLLRQIGYRVPEDIGLAALSVLDGNVDAGIYQYPREIGRVSMLMVASLINDGARGIPPIFRQILISGKWTDGSSLPTLTRA